MNLRDLFHEGITHSEDVSLLLNSSNLGFMCLHASSSSSDEKFEALASIVARPLPLLLHSILGTQFRDKTL